jgi:hypothetical protein
MERLDSDDTSNVSLTSGKGLVGALVGREDNTLAIQVTGAEIQGKPQEVATIAPVEDTFWKQLTGSSTDPGSASLTELTQFSSAFPARSRILVKCGVPNRAAVRYLTTSREPGPRRNNLKFQFLKSLGEHWVAGSTASLLSSDQQDLTLRTTAGVEFSQGKHSVEA